MPALSLPWQAGCRCAISLWTDSAVVQNLTQTRHSTVASPVSVFYSGISSQRLTLSQLKNDHDQPPGAAVPFAKVLLQHLKTPPTALNISFAESERFSVLQLAKGWGGNLRELSVGGPQGSQERFTKDVIALLPYCPQIWKLSLMQHTVLAELLVAVPQSVKVLELEWDHSTQKELDKDDGVPFGALRAWLPQQGNLCALIIHHSTRWPFTAGFVRSLSREDSNVPGLLEAWLAAANKLDLACRERGIVTHPKSFAGLVMDVQERYELLE